MTRNTQIVPALMFHSAGLENHPWAWNHISEPVALFEQKIALLRKQGFNGIFWNELYDHMAGRHILPDNSILLTFDDGYLDNWVYVYPILKRYGMKGTIFVSPDFVDTSSGLRPNLDDVAAGKCETTELRVAGFLNWSEMREMEKSGLMDIQSHAMTHTWYFSGPRITDFHAPHEVTPYPWLFWNARVDRKPHYLNEDQQEFVPWGYPILEHEKSMMVRVFEPDKSAVDAITSFVEARGGREFFGHQGWRHALEEHAGSLFGTNGELPGAYESDQARHDRILAEIRESKLRIERNLNKQVDFICWPGGANDENACDMARAVGYKSWTLSSRSSLAKRNLPGADPSCIKRLGTSNEIRLRSRYCGESGAMIQLWKILAHQGSKPHSLGLKAHKLMALASRFGKKPT